MEEKDLEQYRKNVKERIDALRGFIADGEGGDFSDGGKGVPDADGEFHDLYAGIKSLLDAALNKIQTLERQNQELEQAAQERTREIEAQIEFSDTLLKAQSDLGEGIAILDLNNQKFLYVNPALSRIYGYSREELLALPSALVIATPESVAQSEKRIKLRNKGVSAPDHYESTVIRKDGKRIEIEVAAKIIESSGNTRLLTIVRDITERKQIEYQLRKWADAFINARFAMAIVNIKKRTLEAVNPALAALFGYTLEELVGKPVNILVLPEAQKPSEEETQQALARGHHVWETVGIQKNGTRIPIQVDLTLVKNESGEILYAIANIRDLTRRKKYEEDLRRAHDELEMRVEQRTEELKRANAKLGEELHQREEAEKALATSNAEVQAILAGMTDAYIKFDAGAHFVELNRQAETMLGKKRKELIGKKLWDEFPDLKKGEFHTQYREVQKNAAPSHFEGYLKQAGKWFEVHMYPSGNMLNVYWRDITGRKVAEQDLQKRLVQIDRERAKDEALLESIGEGIVAVDKEGKVMFVNDTAERLFGLTQEEMIGKPVNDVVMLVDVLENVVPFNVRPFGSTLKTKTKVTSSAYFAVRKDGEKIPVHLTSTPILFEGEAIGAIGVYRDITKEKEIDRAKSEFVSLASHQLRTPLTITSWYTEKLKKGWEELPVEQKRYLNELEQANLRMIDLVNALLDVSRIEMGTLTIEPVSLDLREVADSVLSELDPQIKKKMLVLERNYDPRLSQLNADPKLIRIIFQNLFSNAVKYTEEHGKVSVGLEREGKAVRLTVRDTGFGIPKEQQHKVFTKLFRADNAVEREADGTGLGLYIVKSIVDQVGGKIWFESKEKEGTVFFVDLPLAGMPQKKPKSRP